MLSGQKKIELDKKSIVSMHTYTKSIILSDSDLHADEMTLKTNKLCLLCTSGTLYCYCKFCFPFSRSYSDYIEKRANV